MAELSDKLLKSRRDLSEKNSDDNRTRGITESDANRNATDMSQRLRQALKAAGGVGVVSDRSGVTTRSLSRYLSGQDMKVPALVALADACGVSLEWLATGREPSPAATPAASSPAQSGEPARLFSTVNVDQLTACLDSVEHAFATQRLDPPTIQKVRLALLMYDAMQAGETDLQATLDHFAKTGTVKKP